MEIRSTLLPLFVLMSSLALAQEAAHTVDVPFDKAHFSDAAVLRHALAAIKKGDELAYKGNLSQADAMESYKEAETVDPDNAELEMKMGVCTLNGPRPATALHWLAHACKLDPGMARIHFLLAYAYQLNARWDEAIAEYQRHGQIIRMSPDPDRTYNMVGKHIKECKYGKSYMANPVNAVVTDAGPGVNGAKGDYGAIPLPDGRMLFTSRRATTTGGRVNKVNGDYFEDIYASTWQNGSWSLPAPLPTPVNSNRNDATVSLSGDGSALIIYRDETNGGDLYSVQRAAGGWGTPVAFPPQIDGPAQESSAYLAKDGQWLYFVSSREGGLGGADIYRCRKDAATGAWGPAQNLGPDINTAYDEDGVYLTPDGKTLYFASQGHTTMGGYDLFKSTIDNGKWSVPENLGWPINSPGDDQFLVLSADGKHGYFNSVRSGGRGADDIYRVDFQSGPQVDQKAMLADMGKGLPLSPDEDRMTLIGFIKGLKMMNPIEARIELMDIHDMTLVKDFSSDPATGRYSTKMPMGRDYAMQVTAKGYLAHSERVGKAEAKGELTRDMGLKPVAPGATEVMQNIQFKSNSSDLSAGSASDLDMIVRFMANNPNVRLEIGGHTDSDHGPIPNQPLSELRAKAVVDYLVAHGVANDRLVTKGYGSTRPLVPNDFPEHMAMNRRTEIKVL